MQVMEAKNFPYSLGIAYDQMYLAEVDGVQIGLAAVSKQMTGEYFLEWVEIYPPFRKKRLLRKLLSELRKTLSGSVLEFESSEKHHAMYLHIGAVVTGYKSCDEKPIGLPVG